MKWQPKTCWILALPLLAAGCGGDDPVYDVSALPAGVTQHSNTSYPATTVGTGATAASQDLLTGGIGKAGLGTTAPPAYADAANPTAAELRRNALHSNYRAILDPSANGGYGRLYGPNIDNNGADTLGDGLIPGKEYIASIDDGSGNKRVVVAVQIPANFDTANPCIVAGPSSGSRGVYGAIGTAGEWGLKRRCAVALTDAGKGVGLYDPTDDTVNQIDGTRTTRTLAGALNFFAANITDAARATFNAAFPNRLALKHAHSQQNPEKDWGSDTLISIQYAFHALNQELGEQAPDGSGKLKRFTPANTVVIAASVSNGGGAVLRAAEQDVDGLIDGVVATEPNAQPNTTAGYGVAVGGTPATLYGKPLIDVFTVANIYQPCAALAPSVTMTELTATGALPTYNFIAAAGMTARATNRCAALAARGLVTGITTADQATNALQKLRDYGYTADNDTMHNAHYALGNAPIIAMMYTNAHGRFGLTDNLCSMSMAQVNGADGVVVPVTPNTKAQIFAAGNGTANGAPATPVVNNSVGGARSWQWAVSPTSGTTDLGLDSALCQRALVTGKNPVSDTALTAATTPTLVDSQRVQAGIAEVLLNGNLRAKPTLIVAGRSDALVPVNHASRAYVAFNSKVEGAASQVRYVEVENAQHFDTFLPFAGFDTRFVPLHPYFNRAMDAMWARLKSGTALPPSQVVRTTVRGGTPGSAPALSASQVPNFKADPAAGDQIVIGAGNVLGVPN